MCESVTSFSPCEGEEEAVDTIPQDLLNVMAKKKLPNNIPFNMIEINKVAKKPMILCKKHQKQHIKLLRLLVKGADILAKITAENIDFILK